MNENFSEEDRQYELIFKYAKTRRVHKNIAEYRCTNFPKIPEQVFKIEVTWSITYKCGGRVIPKLRDNSGEIISSFKLEDGSLMKIGFKVITNPYAYFLRDYIFLTNTIKQWPDNEMITEKNIWYPPRTPSSIATEKQNEFEIQNKIETQMIYNREEVLRSIYIEQKIEDYSFTWLPNENEKWPVFKYLHVKVFSDEKGNIVAHSDFNIRLNNGDIIDVSTQGEEVSDSVCKLIQKLKNHSDAQEAYYEKDWYFIKKL